MVKNKSLIILSEKSSGSSACQNLLAQFAGPRYVRKTRHFQNETLYWTKAASILGMPQSPMVDSEVPIATDKARVDLLELLSENIPGYQRPPDDREMIMEGWRLLCEEYGPLFLEKSPHHLSQWSAIELILECIEENQDVDFLLIGLVRNPLETIYSQFNRWKSPTRRVESQWITAYRNLLRLKKIVGDRLVVIRYEDLISSLRPLAPVFDFCGADPDSSADQYLHARSVSRAQTDPRFHFAPSNETIKLAQEYGYAESEIVNQTHSFWPIQERSLRMAYLVEKSLRTWLRAGLSPFRQS